MWSKSRTSSSICYAPKLLGDACILSASTFMTPFFSYAGFDIENTIQTPYRKRSFSDSCCLKTDVKNISIYQEKRVGSLYSTVKFRLWLWFSRTDCRVVNGFQELTVGDLGGRIQPNFTRCCSYHFQKSHFEVHEVKSFTSQMQQWWYFLGDSSSRRCFFFTNITS